MLLFSTLSQRYTRTYEQIGWTVLLFSMNSEIGWRFRYGCKQAGSLELLFSIYCRLVFFIRQHVTSLQNKQRYRQDGKCYCSVQIKWPVFQIYVLYRDILYRDIEKLLVKASVQYRKRFRKPYHCSGYIENRSPLSQHCQRRVGYLSVSIGPDQAKSQNLKSCDSVSFKHQEM